MNYYEHHIGDYLSSTSHLTLLEHGVFRRLMDVYYSKEAPIPDADAMRLVCARNADEQAAVHAVLREFFQRDGDVWRQKRCDEVIATHKAFIERQKHAAAKRWHSDGNAPAMPPHDPGISSGNAGGIPPTSHSPLPKGIPAKRGKPKVSIPDAFELNESLAAYARTTLPDADVSRLFQDFRSNAIAKGWKYVDWDTAWQVYCRNSRKDSGHFAAGKYPKLNGGSEWR